MRSQATRLTDRQLNMLAYWKSKGIQIRHNQPIPLNKETPPSFATDHPIWDAMIGLGVIVMVFSGVAFWVATAAKLV